MLGEVPVDGQVHQVDLPESGAYRVLARSVPTNLGQATVVSGLPVSDITDTVHSLVLWEAALTLAGVGLGVPAGTAARPPHSPAAA